MFFLFVLLLFHSDLDIAVVVVDVVVDVVAIFVVVLLDFLFSLISGGRLRTLRTLPARKAAPSDIKQHLFPATPSCGTFPTRTAPHALGHVARLKE